MTPGSRGRTARESASRAAHATPWRVALAVLLVGLLPWSVQSFVGGSVLLRFFWGAVGFAPRLSVSVLVDYPLFAGPPLLLQWALAALFWLLALLSAATGFVDVEDPRVTAGLLVLAGVTNLAVALEFGVQPARTAYPVGTATMWAVAGWRYWAAKTAT